MDSLELLRHRLQQALGEKNIKLPQWGQPESMTQALTEIKKIFDNPKPPLPERSIEKVLLAYRESGRLSSFRDLQYACFGIAQPVADGWRLLEDARFISLLSEVEEVRPEPRRFRKCYQGLLAGYFVYPIFSAEAATENWNCLRQFLVEHLALVRQATHPAGWLEMLYEHVNLLGAKPCERYAQELLAGKAENIRAVFHEGLGISRESWIWQGVVLAQVNVVCAYQEDRFKEALDALLRLVEANGNILSGTLVIQCVAALTIRYAECRERPEHGGLRDAAIGKIGNPWLKRVSWDAHVKTKEGKPHEGARLMINGWVKRQLIQDFFELLSDDGVADQRRLDFWLGYENAIDDMWFAVGPQARQHRGKNFVDFKKRAQGRLLSLEIPGVAHNNAFVMKMGRWIVVEFGAKGNACFIFSADELPFDLSRKWVNGDKTGLKGKHYKRMTHNDRKSGGVVMETWEQKINNILYPLLQFRPSPASGASHSKLTPQEIIDLQSSRNQAMILYIKNTLQLPLEDNRPQGGALWVLLDSATEPSCSALAIFDFKYKPGKGWWKE